MTLKRLSTEQVITRIEHSVYKPFRLAANLAAGIAVGLFVGLGCFVPILAFGLWLIVMLVDPIVQGIH